MNISLLLTLLAIIKATALVSSQETNIRGSLVSCKTNDDCIVTCTQKPCPPKKDCLNGFCRNPKNFEICGPKKLCNKLKGETCCSPSCGICGVKNGNATICPAIACLTPTPPVRSPVQYPVQSPTTKTPPLEKCGNAFCKVGTTCCNPSCSICVPPGGACTQQVCDPIVIVDPKPPVLPPVKVLPPVSPPTKLEKCGNTTCKVGTTCCNPSCGICVPPGGACTKQKCIVDPKPPVLPPVKVLPPVLPPTKLEKCGNSTCKVGTTCCNPSCGICVPPGGACTQQVCDPIVIVDPKPPVLPPVKVLPPVLPPTKLEKCGNTTCKEGTTCCNRSCSICVPKGGACTQQICDPILIIDPPIKDPPVLPPFVKSYPFDQKCGNTTCKAGTTCCNPSCGTCVPPGGVCTQQFCGPDPVIDPYPIIDPPKIVTPNCGSNVCGKGQNCCNPSCGTCVPFGNMCTMQFCGSSKTLTTTTASSP